MERGQWRIRYSLVSWKGSVTILPFHNPWYRFVAVSWFQFNIMYCYSLPYSPNVAGWILSITVCSDSVKCCTTNESFNTTEVFFFTYWEQASSEGGSTKDLTNYLKTQSLVMFMGFWFYMNSKDLLCEKKCTKNVWHCQTTCNWPYISV